MCFTSAQLTFRKNAIRPAQKGLEIVWRSKIPLEKVFGDLPSTLSLLLPFGGLSCCPSAYA